MVNFDQLKDRDAITIDEDQRERLEKARIRKSSLQLRVSLKHHECKPAIWASLSSENFNCRVPAANYRRKPLWS
jgi:hypothetical protein